jgi:hypothetical protein
MSPSPTPPPDGKSLPQRHRPHLGNLSKDTTEKDLWAFDDLESENTTAPELTLVQPRDFKKRLIESTEEQSEPEIPVLSEKKNDQDLPRARPEDEKRNLKVNASPKQPKPSLHGENALKSKPPSDFDELEQWDEPDAAPVTRASPRKVAAAAAAVMSVETDVTLGDLPSTEPSEGQETVATAATPSKSGPLTHGFEMSKLERLGMGALVLLLLGAGILIYFNTLDRLDGRVGSEKNQRFPIQGSHLSVQEADTYWRAPIADGPNQETFRRGTQLLPVLELTLQGGPAAVRVFFRNSDGDLVGDVVTRRIEAGRNIQVAATVGFDDIGMHSAYRTGQSKPWTIEVHEAPSESSSGAAFKKLLLMDISPDRR